MLRFYWDETPERAERIEQLLNSITKTNAVDDNKKN